MMICGMTAGAGGLVPAAATVKGLVLGVGICGVNDSSGAPETLGDASDKYALVPSCGKSCVRGIADRNAGLVVAIGDAGRRKLVTSGS